MKRVISVFAVVLLGGVLYGCGPTLPPSKLATGDKEPIPEIEANYQQAKSMLMKSPWTAVDAGAINLLQQIAQSDPTYKNTLTLLGRAYYQRNRYYEASQILMRALAVNKTDEIAWLVAGLARLRLAEDDNGLENIKGGLTLLVDWLKNRYKENPRWDSQGQVQNALRRAVSLIDKEGIRGKEGIITSVEALLWSIDQEESMH